jgi:DNA-binding transcriptional LysR family regulator
MVRDELSVLSAFLVVAEERSFTRAAKRLGVSQSALSHAMRGLEEQIGVRLLARTTRSVAPTEAGEQVLAHLRPALADIRGALEGISGLRDKPAGRVRLLVPRFAAMTALAPKLGQFARDNPDVVLDITTDDSRVDLVAAGFDAGIQFGEFIQPDMMAVRVSPDHRPAIVGSPDYFQSHPRPKSPRDLLRHRCINFRHGSAGVYRWEFDKGTQSLTVAVNGPLVVDDVEIMTRAAIDGVGLAFMTEEHASP